MCLAQLNTARERALVAERIGCKFPEFKNDVSWIHEKYFRAKAQRRKGAKKAPRNAVALCAFAPLREKSSRNFFGQNRVGPCRSSTAPAQYQESYAGDNCDQCDDGQRIHLHRGISSRLGPC